MYLIAKDANVMQPPLYHFKQAELTVLLTSLSIGGAERIVLDWAQRIYPRWRVHLVLIKNQKVEWPVPSHVRVTRLNNERVVEQLQELGHTLAESGNPTCLCHLTAKKFRDAVREGGGEPIPVLHNAQAGWPEGVHEMDDAPYVIAVSNACANDLRNGGWTKPISVIRHLPSAPHISTEARWKFRSAWNIPHNAMVVGMIGAVKPQKNYEFALHVFKELLTLRDAYLVIVGGPVNMRDGPEHWNKLVRMVHELGIRNRVAMPGFIPFATQCLPTFDVVLNTSHFEGFSIATAETLASGMPIIASSVGGQGEVQSPGLTLMSLETDKKQWAEMLDQEIGKHYATPDWARFPSFRLWTLASLTHPRMQAVSGKTLFVTANLNAGGAQRSLVNLALELKGHLPFEVAVTTKSTSSLFFDALRKVRIPVTLCTESWDTFSCSEALVEKVITEGFETVCFWNVHAQIRVLTTKALEPLKTRIIDVSPGGYGFEEMESVRPFGELVAFSEEQYYQRVDHLVLKFHGTPPQRCAHKTIVIQNGVPLPKRHKQQYVISNTPRIVVSGRLAPSKYIREIVGAMPKVWESFPHTELHFFGTAEPEDRGYMEMVEEYIAGFTEDARKRIFFHGPDFDIRERLYTFDLFVVLGKHQGCPNALLEALAAGLPSIANDDGGTREQVVHEQTGLLISSRGSRAVGDSLVKLLKDGNLRARIGRGGHHHIVQHFSMEAMAARYKELLLESRRGVSSIFTAPQQPSLIAH